MQSYAILIPCFIILLGYFIYKLVFKNNEIAKNILIIGTIVIGSFRIIFSLASSILQGLIWWSDSYFLAKALTPPYAPFTYITSYVWLHFLGDTCFTLIGALGLFFLLKLINKIGHDRFFYEEEYWLGALGGVVVGWPNLILYFFLAMFLNIFVHLIALLLKKEGRISLLYMWSVAIVLTMIFGNKLAILTGLFKLKVKQ